jgi:hypothetical protein
MPILYLHWKLLSKSHAYLSMTELRKLAGISASIYKFKPVGVSIVKHQFYAS